MQTIISKTAEAASLLINTAGIKRGQIFVIGVSTSETAGQKIGTSSNSQIAEAIWEGLQLALCDTGIYLAVQCCEHLNRALAVEQACAERHGLEEVRVVPVYNAGGAMASYAFNHFNSPVMVENIRGHYGMDIGQTLIGMHLKPVAVPVRASFNKIGEALLTMAYSRPKLIGGERAVYVIK